MSFPWYEIIKSPAKLGQGDLIKSCPVLIPPSSINDDDESIDVQLVRQNVIVMSQSCDLEHRHIEKVVVCATMSYQQLVDALPQNQRTKGNIESLFKKLRMGIQPNYHLLDKESGIGLTDYTVVDFRDSFSVHIDYLHSYANSTENRIRLRPPYREQLSQAFARFYMRVGLPHDIGDIDGKGYM